MLGSVSNRKDIEKAAQGVDAIFHVASKIDLHPYCSEELWNVNVTGTQNIIDICLELGIYHQINKNYTFLKSRITLLIN